ncbi:MAG: helicase-related protein, partial [Spirochaetota bacterium]|nr:helicase-related protein [Spirochaetota bacterium]
LKRDSLQRLEDGTAQVIIGTHALFSEDMNYRDLGLIVIDEQHKFGVQQRIKMVEKGEGVDLLVMTATPIPRTLSLTAYGDLDITTIPDKPGRPVKVHSKCIFTSEKRRDMYEFIGKQVEMGRQGFVVCPLIEDSEKLDALSTEEIFDDIRKNHLPGKRIIVLHGKNTADEKESIMTDFKSGLYDVLISTSVIEVGVDVPNASFMVVESADRFGLSQLHQLRGRIGRGIHDSYCFFSIPAGITRQGKDRLRALINHSDGFLLAEEDLKIRGPGEFLGARQSGLDSLKLANLVEDEDILLKAKHDAFQIVHSDPLFQRQENQILSKTIRRRFLEKNQFYLTN